jgi:hypothetical protein
MSKLVVVDAELLELLRQACWSMRWSMRSCGGWDSCPVCGSPVPGGPGAWEGPFEWHASDCKFRVGYEKLSALEQPSGSLSVMFSGEVALEGYSATFYELTEALKVIGAHAGDRVRVTMMKEQP